jgi:nucleotide-binding universal stress UspA family protein
MAVFARILVGFDGTDWGFEALRQTLVLAPAEGSAVHAVTALDTSPAARTGFDSAYWADVLIEEATTARDTAASIIGGRPDSTVRVARGRPLHVLRSARDETDATLLALGGRHSSRFLGIVMGDTATELLHDGTCSVLVARPKPGQSWKPESVVVGLDGSASALAALATTNELATRLGATIEVVSATGDESTSPDSAWADKVTSWDSAHPVAALVERSRKADLIVVGSRGLHGLRALGSTSERVAHQAHCSVLVVHQASPADEPALHG